MVIPHRVIIHPTRRSPKKQLYKTTLDGREVVAQSSDPEFDTCRALKTMGHSGRVEFYRQGARHPGLIVEDLDKATGLRVVETDAAPAIKKWRSVEELKTSHGLKTRTSGLGASKYPFSRRAPPRCTQYEPSKRYVVCSCPKAPSRKPHGRKNAG